MRRTLGLLLLLGFAPIAPAQTAPPPPRQIPPPGLTLTDADRDELTAGAAQLQAEIDALRQSLTAEPRLLALLPDVEIFHKAVDWALRFDEFMAPAEIAIARRFLAQGSERAAQLRAGDAPWLNATGVILRGHRSRLDGSVQPYGLVVPESVRVATGEVPMLVWLLGRGEKRTELAFLAERETRPPQLLPRDTLVVVPYGRFCNATKFAGEVDVFEALAAVRAQYRIDVRRIAVAGFSMGGGSTWHLATHHSGLWCAASPGAGFAETPIFTKADAPGREPRAAWERLLWRQYEATGVSGNLFNVPVLAYAGELDPQKEASELMAVAMAREGLTLERFIGPQTGHKYHEETRVALTQRLEELIARGRDPQPREVWLQTYTLRYPESAWVRIEAMTRHWEVAEVKATLHDSHAINAWTRNVEAIAFPGLSASTVVLDGQQITLGEPEVKFTALDGQEVPLGAAELRFVRREGVWRPGEPAGLRKRPGLTGPVNDAFMDAFLFVRPTGRPLNADVGAWVEGELTAARRLWRSVFRGEVPVKADRTVTAEDIAERHLVLWGDPASNAVLARILGELPLQWSARGLVFRGSTYPATHHAPILVFPNPLNPRRYVVLNSGIDFRADGYGNNALQTPKLPDWAVVDFRTPPGPRWPGRIVEAGFFDEEWK